ncbi:class I SAM-dependent methyltransferase [Candidatus Woesearchaeota archaeon]|nr:class I SAM-dependent methyltransferase [Candidatus Woesearchaeota archaeon]
MVGQKEIYESEITKLDFSITRIKKVKRFIGSLPDGELLDVGCNRGQSKSLFPKHTYNGVDIIEQDCNAPNLKQADITKGFPYEDNKFAVVYAAEILEHVFDTDFFIKECHRILKKNGILLLTTPNSVPLHSRIRTLIFGTRPYSTEARAKKGSPGHIRSFILKDIRALLVENGFDIEKIYGGEIQLVPVGKFLADIFPTLSNHFIVKAVKKLV